MKVYASVSVIAGTLARKQTFWTGSNAAMEPERNIYLQLKCVTVFAPEQRIIAIQGQVQTEVYVIKK